MDWSSKRGVVRITIFFMYVSFFHTCKNILLAFIAMLENRERPPHLCMQKKKDYCVSHLEVCQELVRTNGHLDTQWSPVYHLSCASWMRGLVLPCCQSRLLFCLSLVPPPSLYPLHARITICFHTEPSQSTVVFKSHEWHDHNIYEMLIAEFS